MESCGFQDLPPQGGGGKSAESVAEKPGSRNKDMRAETNALARETK
jgi:hypothetical protein